jgi:parvulin-like peptidyl-prolyl isomerase
MKKFVVAAMALLFMGCLFGSSKMVRTSATLATVDGRIITVANLDSTVKQIAKNSPPTDSASQFKQAALDSLIFHGLIEIRVDSIKQALNGDWDFRQQRLDATNQTIMKVLFQKQIAPRIKVDSAMVQKRYEENPNSYMDAEKVWARHILVRLPKADTAGVKSEKKRKKLLDDSDKFAKDRAQGVLKKALAGENWDTLAAKYSEDKNNSAKGGDLGYFYRGRMAPEFDTAAFAAKPGAIIGPICTKFGYHIIKVEDHKMAAPQALDENLWGQIYADIVNELDKKIAGEYLDSLKAKATFGYNDSALARPESLVTNQEWIMSINGAETLFAKTMNATLPKYKRWKNIDTLTVGDKKDLLGLLSNTYVLRNAARTLGYMQDPEVVKVADDFVAGEANLRMSRYLRNLDYEPTDSEIEGYFTAHSTDYIETRPLLVHHILFQDSIMAETVRDSIIAGADFGEMAKRYYPGDPEIREVLYNLDYIGDKEMGPVFFDAASKLKVGEVSHPVKTSWGYHLIKLVNRKQDRTLPQVTPGIRQHLKDGRDAEKSAKIVSEWRASAQIKINEKEFKKYQPQEKQVIPIEVKAPEQKGS